MTHDPDNPRPPSERDLILGHVADWRSRPWPDGEPKPESERATMTDDDTEGAGT